MLAASRQFRDLRPPYGLRRYANIEMNFALLVVQNIR